ncbi:MAG: LPS export ABC transporter permease LptG [Magnetococcales bacterium]|nr:LPS export ABC transporter permease LptG [Magnetococcales bacterium]MBF0321974.1 LPS export ABC transporter permease LptG [Magnetococcales bacterium]
MRILFRYALMRFIVGFAQVLGVFTTMFFILDGAEQVRRFSHAPYADWQGVLQVLVLRIPIFLVQLLPPIVLLTTLLVLSRLARHNEITVMRAGGISIYRVLLPFLVGGGLVAAIQFLIQDQIVPRANQASYRLSQAMEGRETDISLTRDAQDFWLWDGNRVIHAEQVSAQHHVLFGVTVLQFDDRFHLIRRLDARRAERCTEGWKLIQGVAYDFLDSSAPHPFQQRSWDVALEIEQLDRNTPSPDALSVRRLWVMAERLEREGYDATLYRLVLQRKIANPFAALAAILLAFPFALRMHRLGGTTRSLTAGILAGFIMFITADMTMALGEGGRLPPLVAAWSPVVLFASLGVFMLMHLEEEARV